MIPCVGVFLTVGPHSCKTEFFVILVSLSFVFLTINVDLLFEVQSTEELTFETHT